MTSSIGDPSRDPIARAVLAKIAEMHPKNSPLGSLARTVLSGEGVLREVASQRWHGEGIAAAVVETNEARRNLTSEQRVEIQRAAERLRAVVDDAAGTR